MVDVSKVYHRGEIDVVALKRVSLTLFSHESVDLLGASGSGKSTLLNILGGLDIPGTGDVYSHDRNLTIANEDARTEIRRKNVGFVFQFYNLIPSLTARKNVELVTDIAETPMSAQEALGPVGLTERL